MNLVLQTANELINGDRRKDYGPPEKSFGRIAALWSAIQPDTVTPNDVILKMIMLKVARIAETGYHFDSLVDIAGYAALMQVLHEGGSVDNEMLPAFPPVPTCVENKTVITPPQPATGWAPRYKMRNDMVIALLRQVIGMEVASHIDTFRGHVTYALRTYLKIALPETIDGVPLTCKVKTIARLGTQPTFDVDVYLGSTRIRKCRGWCSPITGVFICNEAACVDDTPEIVWLFTNFKFKDIFGQWLNELHIDAKMWVASIESIGGRFNSIIRNYRKRHKLSDLSTCARVDRLPIEHGGDGVYTVDIGKISFDFTYSDIAATGTGWGVKYSTESKKHKDKCAYAHAIFNYLCSQHRKGIEDAT